MRCQTIKINLFLKISENQEKEEVIFIERFEFTYQDYLNYCDSFYFHDMREEFFCVAEDEAEYKYDENAKDKKHDKIFKDILQDKQEMAKFITDFAKYEVKAEDIEVYKTNYITKHFKYRETDIIYKIKGEEIYFLVEHQTKVDYSMAYRVLNYSLEIIRSVVEGKETNRASFKYPKVIPIVLYTGKQKWTPRKSFAEAQVGETNTDVIDIKYRLVDINEYSVKDLLDRKTMFANAMILEKCVKKEDVINNLGKILRNTPKGKARENLKRIVMYLYEDMTDERKNEILKLIEESEGEENMLAAKRIIMEDRKNCIAQGILKGISQTIERMVKMNLADDIIEQATGAKKSEIEKIRKKVQG